MRPNVRRLPGEGDVPLREIMAALPPGLALSVEFPRALSADLPGARGEMAAVDWAKFVLARTKEFLAPLATTAR